MSDRTFSMSRLDATLYADVETYRGETNAVWVSGDGDIANSAEVTAKNVRELIQLLEKAFSLSPAGQQSGGKGT